MKLHQRHFPRLIALTMAILVPGASPCLAGSLEVGFSDDAGQVILEQEITKDVGSRTALNAVFLRNTQEDTTLGSVGFNVLTDGPVEGLALGAGFKGYLARRDNDNISSAALGILAEFFPPVFGGVGLGANIFYSPKILTGMDAERLLESNARISYRIQERYEIFVAYTNIRADIHDEGKESLDESIRVGMTLSF